MLSEKIALSVHHGTETLAATPTPAQALDPLSDVTGAGATRALAIPSWQPLALPFSSPAPAPSSPPAPASQGLCVRLNVGLRPPVPVIPMAELRLEQRPCAAGSFKTVWRGTWLARPAGGGDGTGLDVALLHVRAGDVSVLRQELRVLVTLRNSPGERRARLWSSLNPRQPFPAKRTAVASAAARACPEGGVPQ